VYSLSFLALDVNPGGYFLPQFAPSLAPLAKIGQNEHFLSFYKRIAYQFSLMRFDALTHWVDGALSVPSTWASYLAAKRGFIPFGLNALLPRAQNG
jgi:hypothetical protein